MNIRHTLAAVLGALALTPAAHAYTLDVVEANGNTVDSSFSSADVVSIGFGLTNGLPITFTLTRDPGEVGILDFNASVENFIGLGIQSVKFSISGGLFSALGTATATFGNDATVSGSFDHALITSSGPEYVFVNIGDWLGDGSQTDFVIDIANATGPVTITLSAAVVPEPEGWAMMLGGLGLIGGFALRRRSCNSAR
jgi:hypothetical protein